MKISVVLPIYIPSEKHRRMTEKCISLAKSSTSLDLQWVIVETGSSYFIDEADIYIYEASKTTPNVSINRAFKLCDGDYVIFLANDVMVCDKWVENMIKCFEKEDCGIGTLGNNEHGCIKEDKIIEKIYFSVCMFKKEEAYFDPNYDNLFDDTDMIMRIYSKGKKCYMNLDGIVDHNPRSTLGANDLNDEESVLQKEYFRNKWSKYKDTEVYRKLA